MDENSFDSRHQAMTPEEYEKFWGPKPKPEPKITRADEIWTPMPR